MKSRGKRTRRKKQGIYLFGLASFMFVITMGLLGVGLARWQDGLTATATVATGNIKPVFAEVQPDNRNARNTISNFNDNNIFISITDAEPNSIFEYRYVVKNTGKIPVRLNTTKNSLNRGEISINNSLCKTYVLKGAGGTMEGTLEIDIGKVPKGSDHSFNLSLDFKQWNL